jgi:cholest-4-en-3-one 26-monooxygenase
MYFRRTTTKPVTVGGVDIPEDEAIVFWHISANRDEDVFDDPFTFDIARSPNPHSSAQIAFGGGGPHFCLGANLARAEMKVTFEALLPHLGRAELVEEPRRLRSNFINGLKEMQVQFR